MGVGGRADQGLWIKTREVYWDPLNRNLLRVSEVGVITLFGTATVPASAAYRLKGLKIGMQFRAGHQVGPDGQHNGQIEFAAAPKDANYTQAGWVWTALAQSTGANSVTQRLGEVFGSPPGSTWRGYQITPQMFAPYPAPAPGQEADERLYFKIIIRNFQPNVHQGQYQVNDVHVAPTVCILADLDFASHYVLGVAAFTVGFGAGALQFDSEVIAHDVPAGTVNVPLPPVPKAPALGARGRPPKPPRVVPVPRRPKPRPRPGPDPAPLRRRRRSAAKRRKR
jgi:hypothetical protein